MHIEIRKSDMLPAQRKWWELPNFIKAMVGGYGSGKTHIGAKRSLYLSYVNSPYPGQYVSPTYKMAEETIVVTIKEMLNKAEIDYTYKEVKHKFLIHEWDGEIRIASGDEPKSLKGPNLAWAGIDEPFSQPVEVFKQMNARVRIKEAPEREIFLTGTPEQLNWGYDVVHNKQIGNSKEKLDVGTVFAKTEDNFHNAEDYVTKLRAAYDENELKAFLNGEFLNLTAGRVYKDFNRDKHVVNRGEKDHPEIMAGIDFNVDYLTAEIFYKGPTWVHFFDEIRLSNATTFDLAKEMKQKYAGIITFPDPSGGYRHTSSTASDHEILKQAGFRVRARLGDPGQRNRVNAVNKMLRDNRMTVEKNTCPWLVKDMEIDTWKKGKIDKNTDESLTHGGDAVAYAIEYLFPVLSRNITYESAW